MRGKLWRVTCLLLLFSSATMWSLGGGGGSSEPTLIGGKGGGGSSSSRVNIKLQNVPYVEQTIPGNKRSSMYCGLASALMVRAMGDDYTEKRSRAMGYWGFEQPDYNNQMEMLDELLQRHANVLECDNLDIAQNGLLYVGSKSDYFEETKNLLYRLYTRNDFISTYPWYNIRNQDNIYDCTLRVEKSTDVMDIIWNHIKQTKKPVITIIDSSKIGESENSWKSLGLRPVLHYNVIYGISETHRERTFHIYDPILNDSDGTPYTESEYRWMLALPRNTPFWLYSYTAYRRWFKITDPCYIMTIH